MQNRNDLEEISVEGQVDLPAELVEQIRQAYPEAESDQEAFELALRELFRNRQEEPRQ